MNELETCPEESTIIAARREGRWSDALTAHLVRCASCREVDALVTWMLRTSAMSVEKPLPDADVVWMMAQVSNRPRLRLDSHVLGGIASLVISTLLAVSSLPVIQGIIGGLVPPRAMSLVPLLVSCVVAAGLAAVALKAGRLLTED
jgi:hypothetical protein